MKALVFINNKVQPKINFPIIRTPIPKKPLLVT
nr:MAG TPA: hypothetical protein [Caudoviricetes sp.]